MKRLNLINIFFTALFFNFIQNAMGQDHRLNSLRWVNGSIEAPRKVSDFHTWCGQSGADVLGWQIPGTDILQGANKVSYYYSPCLLFLKDPKGDYALAIPTGWESDEKITVTMFLVLYDVDLLDRMTKEVSFLQNTQMSIHNLIPLKLLMLEGWPEFEDLLGFEVGIYFPGKTDPSSTMFTAAHPLPINFRVPREFLDEFMFRIQDGMTFNFRYVYPSLEVSKNRFDEKMEISVSHELEQRLFGNRDTVWATREQMLRFFSEMAVEYRGRIYLEDRDLSNFFFQLVTPSLNDAKGDIKEFGEITRGVFTMYGLSKNDDFTAVDFTTMTESEKSEAYANITAMKEFSKFWSSSESDGSVGFLGINASGGNKNADGNESSHETLSQFMNSNHILNKWAGKETDPIKQKIYAIHRAQLKQRIRMALQIDIVGAKGITAVGTKRDTARDITNLDEVQLKKILNKYPKLPEVPRKGAPRIISR